MDENCATDGVFIGRYVLVKYDASADINRVYIDKNGYGYSSINKELVTKLLYKDLTEKFYYDYIDGEQIFYTVKKDSSSEYAIFSQANIEVYEEEEYFKNLIIDKHAYDVRKVSYDGTVWQKSYVDNMEKYIRVANLNSGAPIFSIKPDAPTHWPITPHFEINAVENDKTK
jgi:hypothetical protein